jgi:hypothetical protein
MKRAQNRASSKAEPGSCTSGEEPQTHPSLAAEGVVDGEQTVDLGREDTFLVVDAVDAPKLLRLSRDALLRRAVALGASVLVDER